MKSFVPCAVVALAALAVPAFAQTAPTPAFSQAVTTGIVSLSLNQSAQINVLNLNPLLTTASAVVPACAVGMEFRDAQDNLLQQVEVPNVPPGDAASLTLHRSAASTAAARLAVRAIVRTGPLTPSATGTPVVANTCAVMPTLEIFNSASGDTQLTTSDVRTISTPVAVPVTK